MDNARLKDNYKVDPDVASDKNDESDGEDYHDPGSDEDQSCPICLNDFEEQQIGLPNNCQHVFCIDCILEWSKNVNSCPVDRIKFQSVLVYHRFGGLFSREVSVRATVYKSDDENDVETLCEICHSGHDEATLLLCDGCDLAFHCACLRPPLAAVPAGEWFCDRCEGQRGNVSSSSSQSRLVGRTNLSERVRGRITRSRLRYAENYSTLDEQLDAIVNEILLNAGQRFREITSSLANRQRPGRDRTRRRRSRRRRQSRSRRRGARTNSRSRKSDGPDKKSSFTRNDVKNLQQFSLTGKRNDLNEFSCRRNASSSEEPSYKIARRHRLLTQNAIRYNTPLPSLFSLDSEQSYYPPVSPPPPMPDLLSSILGGQELLFTPCDQVTIQRGGDLVKKKSPEKPKTSKQKVSSSSTSCSSST